MSKAALLFAGQGAQVVGMGKDFFDQIPSVKPWFEKANGVLGYDLTRVCFEGPEATLTQTEHAQPGIFLISLVAFELLRERVPSLVFDATAGLSLGEWTALTAAGALSFEDGLRLVRQRGRFMQEACESSPGAMAAILGLSLELTRTLCAETGAEIANLNCPGQIVISGSADKVTQACQLAKARGAKRALPLPVAGAYHSRLMAGAQLQLQAALTNVRLTPPVVPVVSNVTAQPHHDAEDIVRLLVDQVVSPVRWEDSMRWLLSQGFTRFIELGPGTALSGFMRRIEPAVQMLNVADLASLEATLQALPPSG